MFSMGPGELLLIALVVLVLVGPEKLPEFARTIARTIRDLKKYGQDVRNEFEKDLLTDDIKQDWKDRQTRTRRNHSPTRVRSRPRVTPTKAQAIPKEMKLRRAIRRNPTPWENLRRTIVPLTN